MYVPPNKNRPGLKALAAKAKHDRELQALKEQARREAAQAKANAEAIRKVAGK